MDTELEEIKKRIEKLETQMAFLHRSLGLAPQEFPKTDVSENVSMLVKKGDKDGAIRAFREETGASLKDAKSFIESVSERIPRSHPEKREGGELQSDRSPG